MAKNIAEIDKNLKVESTIDDSGLVWYSAADKRLGLTGLYEPYLRQEVPVYARMPREVAEATSSGVASLYRNTAGGKLRFSTNSTKVAIKVRWSHRTDFSHMPLTGTSGFDLYADSGSGSQFVKSFVPPQSWSGADSSKGYDSELPLGQPMMRKLQINMPLYNNVDELYIGLDKDAVIAEGEPYSLDLPVVYYGSSITQGGCASKPSSSYQAIITRLLNVDHINLGFSGSAKGEQVMAEYIAGIPMCACVIDYQHNANSPAHLEETYYPFYKTIRDKNPTLPILCISPLKRSIVSYREIIRAAVDRARAEGDENVYFLNGGEFFPDDAYDNTTVDSTHPNDLGFYFTAKGIIPVLKSVLFGNDE